MPSAPREPDTAEEVARHAAPWPDSDTFTPGGPSITETEPGIIRMTQASAADIRARTVEMHQSAAGDVTGSTVHLQQGAVGFVRGATVHVESGAVGAVAAEHAEMTNGFALLVVARRVSGQVVVLLDWRGMAAATALLLVLGRLLRGRR